VKKKINIALIIVMAIVYGGIAYKYFGNTTSYEQATITNYAEGKIRLPETIEEKENMFVLDLSNRDPFLDKKYTHKKRKTVIEKTSSKSNSRKKAISMHWPSITYLGFTKSNNQTKKMAVVRIDGKLYRKREGNSIDHIKIIKIENDSIYMMLDKKEKKYFYRNAEK